MATNQRALKTVSVYTARAHRWSLTELRPQNNKSQKTTTFNFFCTAKRQMNMRGVRSGGKNIHTHLHKNLDFTPT